MNFTEKVSKYIQTGTTDDLEAMSSLAFDITVEMMNFFEEWKCKAHNQELARITYYKERKARKRKEDGKPFSDMQADKLWKEQSLQEHDYTIYEVQYRRLKNLLDRLLEKKIEIMSNDKRARELAVWVK